MKPPMKLWKVYCLENRFPGLWRRLYRHQCVSRERHGGPGGLVGERGTEHGHLAEATSGSSRLFDIGADRVTVGLSQDEAMPSPKDWTR